MDNQSKVVKRIVKDFMNACKRNLEIDLEINRKGGVFESFLVAQLIGNALEKEMASIKLQALQKEYNNNLIAVRKGILTLELLEKQDFALN